jgi:polysaccharide export outer membrane protein
VTVRGEPEIEEDEKRVTSDGDISLPLVNRVAVAGLTPSALADRLQRMFATYLRDPVVDVTFVVDKSPGAVSPWGSVTVLGAVNRPGRINIPPTQDLALSMAIQLAGGLGDSARDKAIQITRVDDAGKKRVWTVNLRAAASAGQTQNDMILEPGDIVFVPESVW